jgi:hypothetical protein
VLTLGVRVLPVPIIAFFIGFFLLKIFFLILIFRVTRLFVISIEVNITPGILAISYKGYAGIVYRRQLPGLFIINFLYRNLKTNSRLGRRCNKVMGLLKSNNKDFIYKAKTLEKTKNKLDGRKYCI